MQDTKAATVRRMAALTDTLRVLPLAQPTLGDFCVLTSRTKKDPRDSRITRIMILICRVHMYQVIGSRPNQGITLQRNIHPLQTSLTHTHQGIIPLGAVSLQPKRTKRTISTLWERPMHLWNATFGTLLPKVPMPILPLPMI